MNVKTINMPRYKIKPILWIAIITVLFVSNGCIQQEKSSQEKTSSFQKENHTIASYMESITLDELKDHVLYLSSDELEGRFSCTPGADAAARYIAQHFQEFELQNISNGHQPYFQEFQMQKKKLKECFLESNHAKCENWMHFSERFSDFAGEKNVELVFAGYGQDIELDRIECRDNLVAFFPGDQYSEDFDMDRERPKMKSISDRGAAGFLLIFTDESSRDSYGRFRQAYYHDVRYYLHKTPEEALRSERSIVIFASDLADLFGITTSEFLSVQEKMKSGQNMTGLYKTKVHMKTSYETYEIIDAKNVLGYIEGTDKKDEAVILTAHYDHLGTYRGQVYNGADDNATGVAALLEIAEAFSIAGENGHQPRRSILFLCPDAEEIGANGSFHYLEDPAFPLEKTQADINIDTIGRKDAKRPRLKDFVYVYTSSNSKEGLDSAWQKAEQMLARKPQIEILNIPPGSDNTIFERGGLPVIAFTTGRSRDYHQPSDTADKINFKNMHRIAQLVFATAWEIANQ